MAEFLIELKVEEIPAGMQLAGEQAFKKAIVDVLAANGVQQVTVESTSLSSRLVVWAKNLPEQTADRFEERRGPKADAAFEADGTPSKALQGFMRSCGVESPNALETRETEKGAFLFYSSTVKGTALKDVLQQALPQIIKNIPWPKSMRWGSGEMTFVRPLTNICALWNDKVLPLNVDGLNSNNVSFGHFFLHPEAFAVQNLEHYFAEMENRKVMLCRSRREDEIKKQIQTTAQKLNAKWVEDNKLVAEVAGLVEWPYAVASKVDSRFLELPREVLIITMASHQRYFTLEESNGKLKADFIGISNVPDTKGFIPTGYTKVLTARFDDAKFYWDLDCRTKLENHWPALQKIVFQKELGTVAQKMERVASCMPQLAQYLPKLNVAEAQRVTKLAKADLDAGVVREFPELQGIMGAYYAEREGEAKSVVEAIRTQYENTEFAGMGTTAVAFSLVDRLDTLVGFFGINQLPTGSKDPYALRRAALSIIRLLRQHNMRLPLRTMLRKVYSGYGQLAQNEDATINSLMDFFMARLQVALKEEGVDHDLVAAVFAQGLDDIVDICNRAQALQQFMDGMGGAELHEAFKRAANILQQAKAGAKVEQSAFVDEAEKQLFNACTKVEKELNTAVADERYEEAMQALASLKTPLQGFFEQVMVMADDATLRQNRVALLGYTTSLFQQVADFGHLAR